MGIQKNKRLLHKAWLQTEVECEVFGGDNKDFAALLYQELKEYFTVSELTQLQITNTQACTSEFIACHERLYILSS